MRTPNTSCLLCTKPLYRRPYELAKTRYAACMACRSEAQKFVGITEAQYRGLSKGSVKGKNYRNGRRDSLETKAKKSASIKQFYALYPEKAVERGSKTRGELNVRWKGGLSRLNTSIRTMTENRKWTDAVKERDGRCVYCGSMDNLESHHKQSLAELVDTLGIRSRDDARKHAAQLWNLNNGETLCEPCHYAEHDRAVTPRKLRKTNIRKCKECDQSFVAIPSRITKGEANFCCRKCHLAWRKAHPLKGEKNPNWRGGLHSKPCQGCSRSIWDKIARIDERKFCSRECCNANK